MQLITFTARAGGRVWINPEYVAFVSSQDQVTELHMASGESIVLAHRPRDVVAKLQVTAKAESAA